MLKHNRKEKEMCYEEVSDKSIQQRREKAVPSCWSLLEQFENKTRKGCNKFKKRVVYYKRVTFVIGKVFANRVSEKTF